MCGLISIIGKITVKEEKIFKQGLIVDSLRGEHSTGVAITRRGKDGETFIAKQVGNPFELFNDKRFDKAMGGSNRILLGHNRYATQGAINKANAHPFEFWPVYGAHNGTLSERKDLEENHLFSVDSQALLNHISIHGVEDAIPKVRGAWALTWWDEEKQTFNVLRNKERTLYTAKDKEKDVRYFSSEYEMLFLLLSRNEVKYDKITSIPEDTWLSFEVGTEGELSKPKSKIVKGKPSAVVTVHNNHSHKNVGNPHANSGSNINSGYRPSVLRNDVTLEVVAKYRDRMGAGYYKMKDAENPLAEIRLYHLVMDEFKFNNGTLVVANINSFVTSHVSFYRVNPVGVRKATAEEQLAFDAIIEARKEEKELPKIQEEEKKYPDARGRLLSKEDWQKAYPHCDWCTMDVDPEETGIFLSKGGSVFCPSCAANKEAMECVMH